MVRNIRGSMSVGIVASLALVGLLGLMALIGIVSYIGAFNYGNTAEKALTAKFNDNKNILGQYTIKIGEMAQVPDMARDDLLKVITATFEGRYGEGGSKATWQWLKEQNPSLDPSLYARIQQAMEAGRNDFTVSQTQLLDQKRVYETALGSFWQGMWLGIAGYPKIELDKIKIVVAADTEQKFESGVDDGVQLRKPAATPTP